MLRKKISRLGMATAGAAVGAIMAISPVFAHGTTPSSPSNTTLLASILAAAQAAGLTAAQTKELLDVAAEISVQAPETQAPETQAAASAETEDEDETEDDDDAGAAPAAPAAKNVVKHQASFTAAASKSGGESKGGDD